ncbi:hypothetical protein HF313_02955 [Massilia atriviolacea]|uniref:Uncharacterized protein n=1 Tax=Massilia atriviolacea TaxID=2495579 RepID=A0A430HPB7_9BURK|nr:hypothetical protein [Massilia atriviolacea]RSZ59361.1 hypothetical protein EJB06_09345 [Massilia atriviolacea]
MTPVPPNVYAAPKSSFQEAPLAHCWREGDMLVAPAQSRLPLRCVKCNAPATLDRPRAFYWNHPGWYLLLLVVVYVAIALFVRKKAIVSIGLCGRHRRRRRLLSWGGYGLFALGLYALMSAIDPVRPFLGWVGCLLMLAGILCASIGARLLRVVRITDHEIRFKGCGPAFLDSLPPH